jgi:hypothetical protein
LEKSIAVVLWKTIANLKFPHAVADHSPFRRNDRLSQAHRMNQDIAAAEEPSIRDCDDIDPGHQPKPLSLWDSISFQVGDDLNS